MKPKQKPPTVFVWPNVGYAIIAALVVLIAMKLLGQTVI